MSNYSSPNDSSLLGTLGRLTLQTLLDKGVPLAITAVTSYVTLRNADAIQTMAKPFVDKLLLPASSEQTDSQSARPKALSPSTLVGHAMDMVNMTGVKTRTYVPKQIPHLVDVTDPAVIDLLARGVISDLTQIASEDPFLDADFSPKLIESVEKQLNLSSGNRVLLSGDSQSGKTTFIQNFVNRVLRGEARGTLSHTEERGQERLGRRVFQLNTLDTSVFEVLSKTMGETCILVVDEAHTVFHPESFVTRIQAAGIDNCAMTLELKKRTSIPRTQGALPPILAATNNASYIFEDIAMKTRFKEMRIPPRTTHSEIESLIKRKDGLERNLLLLYKQLEAISISDEALETIVYLVPLYAIDGKEPNAFIEFLNRVVEEESVVAMKEGKNKLTIDKDKVLNRLHIESQKSRQVLEKRLIQRKDQTEGFPIPYGLNSCLTDMTLDPENMGSLSLGRSQELQTVIQTLMKETTNNMILQGSAGVGKTCFVQTLAYLFYLTRSKVEKTPDEEALLKTVTIPDKLVNMRILQLRLTILLKADNAISLLEELFNAAEESGQEVVLFIDEFHLLLDPARNDLLEALKAKLTSEGGEGKGRVTLIGATNMVSAMDRVQKDTALARRFESITLREPDLKAMLEIIARKYPDDVMIPGVREAVHQLKDKLRPGFSDPDNTLHLMSELKSWCELEAARRGEPLEQIGFEEFKDWLADTFVEPWDTYWAPLLGKADPVVKIIDKRLSTFEWVCFKVRSIFSSIFCWQSLDYPTEEISEAMPIPTKRATRKRGETPPHVHSMPKVSEFMDGARERIDAVVKSPLGNMGLRMFGVNPSTLLETVG